MTPDRGHLHHRLIDMGLSQRSAVITLYALCIILAVSAVVMLISDFLRALVLFAAIVLVAAFTLISRHNVQERNNEESHTPEKNDKTED